MRFRWLLLALACFVQPNEARVYCRRLVSRHRRCRLHKIRAWGEDKAGTTSSAPRPDTNVNLAVALAPPIGLTAKIEIVQPKRP